MSDIMAILTLILIIISCFTKKEINETLSEPKWLNEEHKAIFHDSNDQISSLILHFTGDFIKENKEEDIVEESVALESISND